MTICSESLAWNVVRLREALLLMVSKEEEPKIAFLALMLENADPTTRATAVTALGVLTCDPKTPSHRARRELATRLADEKNKTVIALINSYLNISKSSEKEPSVTGS